MIKILNEPRGLSFHDWIDVYLSLPNEVIIGNHEKDLGETTEHESYWLKWLMTTKGEVSLNWKTSIEVTSGWKEIETKEIPQVVKEGRGIGAWWNPEYIIVTENISATTKLGKVNNAWANEEESWGHPYWDSLPRYKRLRPFMENARQLKFFFHLFSSCPSISPSNSYITSFKKPWRQSRSHSFDLFSSEMSSLNDTVKTVILLGLDISVKFKHCEKRIELLWPEFYGTWHGVGWKRYREKFCQLICGGEKR